MLVGPLVFLFFRATYCFASGNYSTDARDVLRNMDTRVHPNRRLNTPNPNRRLSTPNVSATIVLSYIENLSEASAKATLLFFVELKWYDFHFDEIQTGAKNRSSADCLMVPARFVWTPQVSFVVNVLEQKFYPPIRPHSEVAVCSDGNLVVAANCRVTVFSLFDVQDFPFDEQEITVYFGHISAGSRELDIFPGYKTLDQIVAGGYHVVSNEAWSLKGTRNPKKRVLSQMREH